MPYVDGFVVAVPKARMADYKKIARKHGKVWRDHGALAYVECVGDDVPYGKREGDGRCKNEDGHVEDAVRR